MNPQTRLQIVEASTDRRDTEVNDTDIAPKPSLASRLGQALVIVSVPITLAWVAMLGWLCFDLFRILL